MAQTLRTRRRGRGRLQAARAACVSVGLVGGLLPGAVRPAFAQGGEVLTEITGFESLDWGATAEAVIAAFGQPGQTEIQDSLSILVYRMNRLGQEGVGMFAVHQALGLVKGQYLFPLVEGEGADCEAQFREVQRQINITYPLIHPDQRIYNNVRDEFCIAQENGEAGRLIQWTDEKNSSTIVAVLSAGKTNLQVAYESLSFKEWATEKENRRLAAEAASDDSEAAEGESEGKPDPDSKD